MEDNYDDDETDYDYDDDDNYVAFFVLCVIECDSVWITSGCVTIWSREFRHSIGKNG